MHCFPMITNSCNPSLYLLLLYFHVFNNAAATKAMIDAHTKSQYAMMTKMQELYGVMGGGMPGK